MWNRFLALGLSVALAPVTLAQTRSEQPLPIGQLGGVRASFPAPSGRAIAPPRMALPFVRTGPTARTIGDGPRPGPQYQRIDHRYQPLHHVRDLNQLPSRAAPSPRPRPGFPTHLNDGQDLLRRRILERRAHGPWVIREPVFGDTWRYGTWTEGSGLSINGSYRDDNFRLGFHIGAPTGNLDPFHKRRWGRRHHGTVCPPITTFPLGYSFYGLYPYDYYYRPPIYGAYAAYDPFLYSTQTAPAPAPAPAEPEFTPANDKQRGDVLLSIDPKQAIAAYQAHLKLNPGDADAMRSLGIAMILNNQMQDGVAMVSLAYRSDATLAAVPFEPKLVGGRDDLRRTIERVSVYANRVQMASGWLTLAALMQGEGRTRLAQKMIERAKAVGLEPEIAAQMSAALRS